MKKFDCAIVGAGPAGLNAALVLARAKKQVIIFDDDTNRNKVTNESHSFLTRDGIKPKQFKELALDDILKYDNVTYQKEKIEKVNKNENGLFTLSSSTASFTSKAILIATGVHEVFSDNLNIEDYYGKTVFSCPFCDGWEQKEKKIVLISENEEHAIMKGKLIKNWTDSVFIVSNGKAFSTEVIDTLENMGISYYSNRIQKIIGRNGIIESIKFDDDSAVQCSAGFIDVTFERNTKWSDALNFDSFSSGEYVLDPSGRTTQNNVYVAGEATTSEDSSLIIAASEGYKAAVAIVFDQLED